MNKVNESYYRIASHILRIVSAEEIHPSTTIQGFLPFEIPRPDSQPALTVRSVDTLPDWGETEQADWDIQELYSFDFEGIACSFARYRNGYLFRMAPPGDRQPFLLLYDKDNRPPFPIPTEEVAPGETILFVRCAIQPVPILTRFALWMGVGLATLAHQTVAIHASVICHHGQAVLFLGESGTGKSTHTGLWREHIPGSVLLNDDSPLLRIEEGTPWVYGSPWSGKTPCYRNERAPLAAIVRLRQAPANHITRLSSLTALGALLPSCPPAFTHDEKLSDYLCEILSVILMRVPVYSLDCLPDQAAAKLAFSTIFNTDPR